MRDFNVLGLGLALCTGCGAKGEDSAGLEVVPSDVTGTMTLAGVEASTIAGIAYYEDFFYDSLVVAFVPWAEVSCTTLTPGEDVYDWLGAFTAQDGGHAAIIPLEGDELGGGDVWQFAISSISRGMAGVGILVSELADVQTTDTVGQAFTGGVTFFEGSGAHQGDLTFSVPFCGDP